ncbi:hypothetical protein SDC9_191134 [bioreactor metagenome]|uniref:Uncharacterized protein n=1 Tax=bioreactor metagenome TaxID=1076179 RepID=A0A645I583_9ZZZZ
MCTEVGQPIRVVDLFGVPLLELSHDECMPETVDGRLLVSCISEAGRVPHEIEYPAEPGVIDLGPQHVGDEEHHTVRYRPCDLQVVTGGESPQVVGKVHGPVLQVLGHAYLDLSGDQVDILPF